MALSLAPETRDGTKDDWVQERRWWTLGVLCICLMVVVIDNTILNVALPSMQEQLHASQSQEQWFIDAYTLVFAALLFTGGVAGDRWGRRRLLQAGMLGLSVQKLDPVRVCARRLDPLGSTLVYCDL